MSSRARRVRPVASPSIPPSVRRSSPLPSTPTSNYAATTAPSYSYTGSGSSYPTFLSLQDTARLHLNWGLAGLLDACRWDRAVMTVLSDPEVQMNAFKSLLLNGLSLVSIFTFDLLILPLLPIAERQRWFHRNLGVMYNILWLWPVVGASLWLNNIWCSTIARKTFTLQHGQVAVADTSSYGGMLQSIATSAYRLIFLLSYVFLQMCLAYVPYVGSTIGFVFTCWVNSYYCFEFVGVARGMNLAERLKYHEERWAYYLAFGLPSAMLCMWGNSLANAALYALLFPAFIIMAMHGNPVPRHPYAPVSPSPTTAAALPSPFVPIRIPIFSPVIAINDIVVRALSVGSRSRRTGGGGKKWEAEAMEVVEEGTELDVRRKLD